MTIEISVTKEVLEASKYCGIKKQVNFNNRYEDVSSNCAISKAIWNVLPYTQVGSDGIYFYRNAKKFADPCAFHYKFVSIPNKASNFIHLFDSIKNPEIRTKLTPISFNIDIPEEVIENISIEEIINHLKTSKTMKLVNV